MLMPPIKDHSIQRRINFIPYLQYGELKGPFPRIEQGTANQLTHTKMRATMMSALGTTRQEIYTRRACRTRTQVPCGVVHGATLHVQCSVATTTHVQYCFYSGMHAARQHNPCMTYKRTIYAQKVLCGTFRQLLCRNFFSLWFIVKIKKETNIGTVLVPLLFSQV